MQKHSNFVSALFEDVLNDVFGEEMLARVAKPVDYRVKRMGRDSLYVEKPRMSRYSEPDEEEVRYEYPSVVEAVMVFSIPVPAGIETDHLEGAVEAWLKHVPPHTWSTLFNDDILNTGGLYETLEEGIESEAKIQDMNWSVNSSHLSHVAVRMVSHAHVELSVAMSILLDIGADDSHTSVEMDAYGDDDDGYDDRYGSLRDRLTRLAHVNTKLRPFLLPILASTSLKG